MWKTEIVQEKLETKIFRTLDDWWNYVDKAIENDAEIHWRHGEKTKIKHCEKNVARRLMMSAFEDRATLVWKKRFWDNSCSANNSTTQPAPAAAADSSESKL
jgi:hypothetical protein